MEVTTEMLIRNCGIPREYAGLGLDDMDFSIYRGRALELALKKTEALARSGSFKREPLHVLIDGGFGNGKTRSACHLVQAAYHAYVKHPRVRSDSVRPRFITSHQAARNRFDNESEEWTYLFDSCFLALDDVNRLAGYKGEQDFVESVIEERRYRGLSTVVTMNVRLENVDGRLGSFLKQFARLMFADAPDQRGR